MFINRKLVFLFLLYGSVFAIDETDEAASTEPTKTEESEESNESKITDNEPVVETTVQSSICGYRNTEESLNNEFTWMVGVFSKNELPDAVRIHECGGALIAPDAVLTSAHCVSKFKETATSLEAQIGFKDDVQSKTVKKITMLDHFELDYHMNAIAILILTEPFELKEHIKPICLPSITANFEEATCQLLHYNSTYDVGFKSYALQISPVDDCTQKLRQINKHRELPLHESIICAKSTTDEELCQNMLGSSLICAIPGVENRFVLAGIASFGESCTDDTHMHLFVNVALFSRWIEFRLRQENIESHYFTT